MPSYAASGFEHFANAKAATGPEIVDELVALAQRVEHKDMRAGEIVHVNVVADAGAIRGGIVGAKDRDVFTLPECDLQREGNQVRLRHMVFAQITGGSGSVEIAQARISQPVNA